MSLTVLVLEAIKRDLSKDFSEDTTLKIVDDRAAMLALNILDMEIPDSINPENFHKDLLLRDLLLVSSSEKRVLEKNTELFRHVIRDKKFYYKGSDLHMLINSGKTEEIEGYLQEVIKEESKIREKSILVPDLSLLNLLEIQDVDGNTAIHLAIEKDFTDEALNLLLKMPKAQRAELLKIKDKEGDTVIHRAIEKNYVALGMYMLEKARQTDLVDLLKIQNEDGETILHTLISEDRSIVLNLLLKVPRDKRAELLKIKDTNGNTAIDLAIKQNNESLAKYMLETLSQNDLGALLRIQYKDGETILHTLMRQIRFADPTDDLTVVVLDVLKRVIR